MTQVQRTLALILIFLSLQACRFGNRTIAAQSPSDGVSGYYATSAESLILYATMDQTHSQEASPINAPPDIRLYLSNPVALILSNPSTGDSILVPPESKNGFPIRIDLKTLTFSYIGGLGSRALWNDVDCTLSTEILMQGNIRRDTSMSHMIQNQYPLSGRLKIQIQVIHHIEGNCELSLKHLASCYQDSAQCGGSSARENSQLKEQAQSLLSSWVKAKAIDLEQITRLENFAYELDYE